MQPFAWSFVLAGIAMSVGGPSHGLVTLLASAVVLTTARVIWQCVRPAHGG